MNIYKKIGSVMLSIILLVVFMSSQLVLDTKAVDMPTLTAEGNEVSAGEQLQLSIKLTNAAGVYGGNFTLKYNSELLVAESYEFTALVEHCTKNCNLNYQSAGNLIRATWSGDKELEADGVIIAVQFKAKKAGTAEFRFQDYRMYSDVGALIPSTAMQKDISIAAPDIASISVSTKPSKTTYELGEELNTTGLAIKVKYTDGTTEIVSDGFTVSGYNPEMSGVQSVLVTYREKTARFLVTVNAVSSNEPTIVVDAVEGKAGETVVVNVGLRNNPGVASLNLNVSYGSQLTLTTIQYNDAIGGIAQQPQTMNSPVVLNWINGTENSYGDFVFATLTFHVSEDVDANSVHHIEVTYDPDNIYNIAEESVAFEVQNGSVVVKGYMPGDINDDGKVNNRDLTRLFQYLSKWEVEVNDAALDVNGDGKVNNRDLTRLFQYLSNWDVQIY